jgi:DNA-binding transcriptional MocR family regulator
MSESVQYPIQGRDAASVARSVERGVASGALRPGDSVPSVRALARELGLSPTTVAAAYRELRQRGVLVSRDRSGTFVGNRPPLGGRLAPEVPAGTVDLATGNPDPSLLPDLGPPLARVGPVHRLYGDDPVHPALLTEAREAFEGEGVATGHLAVVGGGLDGIERVLEAHLHVGDRIAVEDPGYVGALDLCRSLGLQLVGVGVDDEGLTVEGLEAALDDGGVRALLTVPRAQNPTGASLTGARAAALRSLLADHPQLLVVEDEPLGVVAGTDPETLTTGRERWARVRSLGKALGPDLRVAVLAGDEDTVTRVTGRQRLGTGWVSHLLQKLAADVWRRSLDDGTLRRATETYAARREALLRELEERGIPARGASGLNVWVTVSEEVPVVQGMMAAGWSVQAGEPFRLQSPPGVRITTAALDVADAPRLADDLASVLDHRLGTRRG